MKPVISFFILILSFSSFGQDQEVMEFPDEEAHFVGGIDSMMAYLTYNLVYPELAIMNDDQGTVYIQFVVEKNGSISNIEIHRGVTAELDREAFRVIKSMPDWIPGKVQSKPCRTRCRIPIAFTLEHNTVEKKKRRFRKK